MENIELIKGHPYMVKHHGGKKAVRRIYRGEETGVLDMKRLVFTAKVNKGVFAVVDEQTNDKGEKTGICFYHWKNTQSVPVQEISIPYYDLKDIKPISIN